MKAKAILFFLFLSALMPQAWAADFGEDDDYLGHFVDDYENDTYVDTAVNVVHNATLDAMHLNYTGALTYRNFTAWTEDDPNNDLTQTDTRSTWGEMTRGETQTALYSDEGVDAIGLNFNYIFTVHITDVEAGDADTRALGACLGIDNVAGAAEPDGIPRIYIYVMEDGANDDKYTLYMKMRTAAINKNDWTIVLDAGTSYYCNLIRNNSGNDLTFVVRTGSHAGPVIDVLTLSDAGFNSLFRYLKAPQKEDYATDVNDHFEGYVEYLSTDPSTGYVSSGYYVEAFNLTGTGIALLTNSTILTNTAITLEFSDDNVNWVNHNDVAGHDNLATGLESFDMRDLNFTNGFARFNLTTTDKAITPLMLQFYIVNVTPQPTGGGLFPGLAIGIALLIIGAIYALEKRR